MDGLQRNVFVIHEGLDNHIDQHIARCLKGDAAHADRLVKRDILLLVCACRPVNVHGLRHIAVRHIRIGQHALVTGVLGQGRQLERLHATVAGDSGLRSCQIAHGLLGCHPRAAALAPARTVEDTYLDVQLGSLLQGGMHDLPPSVTQHLVRTGGNASLPDVTDEGTSDARLLHRLQVVFDALDRDIITHPVPIDSHTMALWHTLEVLLQFFAAGLKHGGACCE